MELCHLKKYFHGKLVAVFGKKVKFTHRVKKEQAHS